MSPVSVYGVLGRGGECVRDVLSGNTVALALVALASELQRSTRIRNHFTVSSLLLIGLYVIQAVSISKDKKLFELR